MTGIVMNRFKSLGLFVYLLLLIGCGATEKTTRNPILNIEVKSHFQKLLDVYKEDPLSYSYSKLWHSYLESDQIKDSGIKQEKYDQIVLDLSTGNMSCTDINWTEVTEWNFWSIKPHITAENCYTEQGNIAAANFHAQTIEFLLTGILSSGNGKHYYSAYEVGTWGDASDVMELTGYEVIDSFLQLQFNGQALLFTFIVNDPETGFQQEIHFQNSKFLHQILDIQYPFAGINDTIESSYIDFMQETNEDAKIAKGKLHFERKEYDKAAKLFSETYLNSSAYGSYQMGLVCLSSTDYASKADCLEYLFESAEYGYNTATIFIAMLYKEGIGVNADEALFKQLMESVEPYYPAGESWYILAEVYNQSFIDNSKNKIITNLKKAADLGHLASKMELLQLSLSTLDVDNEKERQQFIDELDVLAENGLDAAQAVLANFLLRTKEKGPADFVRAQKLLKESSSQGNPFAHYLLGNAYEYGYFGETDKLKAYFSYNEAALRFNSNAQLQIGYMNDQGIVVEEDKNLALSWYILCSRSNNMTCIRNVGLFFKNGIVVDQNYEIALANFKYAAQNNNASSMVNLGLMYNSGEGVSKDIDQANAYFTKACDLNNSEGCRHLASYYLNGGKLELDWETGKEVMKKSCDLGDYVACHIIKSDYVQFF